MGACFSDDHTSMLLSTAMVADRTNFPLQCVGEPYILDRPATLIVQENLQSQSGDDFKVFDTEGRLWFYIDGRVFSHKSSKILKDYQGSPICSLNQKIFSFGATQHIHAGQMISDESFNERRLTLKQVASFKPKMNCYMQQQPYPHMSSDTNLNGVLPSLSIVGNYTGHNYIIQDCNSDMNHCIARVSRDCYSGRNLMTGKDTYGVQIPSGVDAAMIVALVVMIDEAYHDVDYHNSHYVGTGFHHRRIRHRGIYHGGMHHGIHHGGIHHGGIHHGGIHHGGIHHGGIHHHGIHHGGIHHHGIHHGGIHHHGIHHGGMHHH